MKWVLLAEGFLRGSVRAAWSWFPVPETVLNWGPSLLLAPAVAAAGRNLLFLKLYSTALLAAGLWLFHETVRKDFALWEGRLLLVWLFLPGFVLSTAGNVTSEPGFMFLSGLCLYLLFARGWRSRGGWGRCAALGGLTALLVLTRTVGAVFFVLAAWQIFAARGRRDAAVYAAVTALGVLPYLAVSKLASGSVTFYSGLWALRAEGGAPAVLSGAVHNLWYYFKGISGLTWLYAPALLPNAFWIKLLLTSATLAAVVVGVRRAPATPLRRFLTLYLAGMLAVLAVWSYQSPRYALPLYPAFLVCLLEGLRALPRRKWALGAAAALTAVSQAPEVARLLGSSFTGPAAVPRASYDWLREHAAPSDMVVSMDIPAIHFFTGLRGTPFLPAGSAEEFARASRAAGARYFLVRDADYEPAAPGVADPVRRQHDRLEEYLEAPDFELVYRNPDEGVKVHTLRRAP